MRKITTRKDKEKKKRRTQIIVGVILVGVMLFSVLGYSFQGQEEPVSKTVNYKGFEFFPQNNFWFLEMGSFQFLFKYNPKEVPNIDKEINKLSSYANKPLYISSSNQEAEFEIYNNLDQVILRRQYACLNLGNISSNAYEPIECAEELPIKTCEDNFIIIQESDVQEIAQEGNCVFIKGPIENLTKITDEFLFKIIGIE
ncbi:MAG: hypothetical protein ABIH59_01260 [archaeon]